MMLRTTVMASTVMPSGTVRRYHGRSFSSGSTRCSFGVSEYTNLTSSAAGLGLGKQGHHNADDDICDESDRSGKECRPLAWQGKNSR